ncbi:MAG: hypothetical protein ABIH83_02705 [Candidatus Micrarchaeota archaeon]
MAEVILSILISKEDDLYVITDKKFSITSQGKSVSEAIKNFYGAFESCYTDPDWRKIHSMPAKKPQMP